MSDRSYSDESYASRKLLVLPISVDLTGTAADVQDITFGKAVEIKRLGFLVTTTVAADTTAPVVSLEDSSNVELASLTIPDTSAAKGEVVTSTISSGKLIGNGETLTFKHKTQAADASSAAGAGLIYIEYVERFEV